MIHIEQVSKSFGKFQALKNLNTDLGTGECIALIGPNGSGKTTLIKCILGLVIPDSGVISVNGHPIHRDWRYREHIGYMPQTGRYPDNMTIGQVIGMIKSLRSQTRYDEELYHAFRVEELLHKKMRTLSGGTRQKVNAVLSFLFDPDILILDEPTAGLDPLSSEILKQKIIRERDSGKLIVITSHIMSDLEDLVNRVIFIQEGTILYQNSIAGLKEQTGEAKLSAAVASIMKHQL